MAKEQNEHCGEDVMREAEEQFRAVNHVSHLLGSLSLSQALNETHPCL